MANTSSSSEIEEIILAAGCFWGVEHILAKIAGVVETRCGYIGGALSNPSYRDVCSGDTGHAEAVLVRFNKAQISLDQVLQYFWRLHDPTQLNRQGPDVGSQYRSAIFYFNDTQKEICLRSKDRFDEAKVFSKKAVTTIELATPFYDAEVYHQNYFDKNPNGHICHILRPK